MKLESDLILFFKSLSNVGNPRNKVALGPGKSLMDWVSLCSADKEMAGMGRKLLNISKEELATHNKPTDAWLAIGGITLTLIQGIHS